MTDFYHSTSLQQSALMLLIFFALVLSLYNLFALSSRRKMSWLHYANAGVFLVLFALDAHMGDVFLAVRAGAAYQELLPLPMWTLWCAAALVLVLLLVEDVVLLRLRRRSMNRDSIKQAMDSLPSAICYFTPEGAVKLCNLQMHRLYHALSQSDLQSLYELHSALTDCERQSGVIVLSEALQTYLFPDGKAWRYMENSISAADGVSYTEAIFTDVTKLYQDSLKLEEQTKRLEALSNELKQLSRNALTVAREQEILSAKTALHDRMGAGVLAVRRILQSGRSTEDSYALELFQGAVQFIKHDNECPMEQGELAKLLHDAAAIGVKLKLTGELPCQQALSRAFILAMRECLTNAVRHADASEMNIVMEQNESAATLRISNNGAVPQHTIVPKGGLKNLHSHIAMLRGAMELQSQPSFELRLTIPFAKEDA